MKCWLTDLRQRSQILMINLTSSVPQAHVLGLVIINTFTNNLDKDVFSNVSNPFRIFRRRLSDYRLMTCVVDLRLLPLGIYEKCVLRSLVSTLRIT